MVRDWHLVSHESNRIVRWAQADDDWIKVQVVRVDPEDTTTEARVRVVSIKTEELRKILDEIDAGGNRK